MMDLKTLQPLSIKELKEVQARIAALLKDKALAEIEDTQNRLNELRELAGLRKAARARPADAPRRGKKPKAVPQS